jgi:hypothetical protein
MGSGNEEAEEEVNLYHIVQTVQDENACHGSDKPGDWILSVVVIL